jgi:adenine-specific DNA-methyltransferase
MNHRRFPPTNRTWTTTAEGFRRLSRANRVYAGNNSLNYTKFLDDFPANPLGNLWDDLAGASDKIYVVQTNQKVIERCLLMTTDPGDLVLDPTCGSGTTAYVAEKWGRRWITCDTSRVAVTLAKQRLMTASYDYYELRYPHEGLRGGFIWKTVPHVTLKSIANNPDIDAIYERLHPAVEQALAELNKALKAEAKEWEVPFDFPDGADPKAKPAFEAFHAARQAMQKAMDRSIADHADQETLYDQPAKSKSKLRITGPFSVEAVPFPTVQALDDESRRSRDGDFLADASIARSGESSRQHQWRDELLKTGIRGKGGQMLKFAELETLPGTKYLHGTGHTEDGQRVVVHFGPEHAALEQRAVTNALEEAGNLFPLPKMIVFCAFAFDPEAAKDIDHLKGITALEGADEHRPADRGPEEGSLVEPEPSGSWASPMWRCGSARTGCTRSKSMASTTSTRRRANWSRAARAASRCGRSTPTTTSARCSRIRCSSRWPARARVGKS